MAGRPLCFVQVAPALHDTLAKYGRAHLNRVIIHYAIGQPVPSKARNSVIEELTARHLFYVQNLFVLTRWEWKDSVADEDRQRYREQ